MADDEEQVCWYEVWYWRDTGEIFEVNLLFCEGGRGGCSSDQIAIANEYENRDPGGAEDWPCSKFRMGHDAEHRDGDVGIHNHKTGFHHRRYYAGKRVVLRYVELNGVSGAWLESSWRCPIGNASVGGSAGSQHVEGTAGDFDAPRFEESDSIRDVFAEAAAFANAGWSREYSGWYHIDWR